ICGIDAIAPCAHAGGVATRHPVWILLFDGVQSLDVAGPYEVFAGADEALGRPCYAPRPVSLAGGPIACESGLAFVTEPLPSRVPRGLTLVLPGGRGARQTAPHNPQLIATVRRVAERADRVLTVCTGTFVAAAA